MKKLTIALMLGLSISSVQATNSNDRMFTDEQIEDFENALLGAEMMFGKPFQPDLVPASCHKVADLLVKGIAEKAEKEGKTRLQKELDYARKITIFKWWSQIVSDGRLNQNEAKLLLHSQCSDALKQHRNQTAN